MKLIQYDALRPEETITLQRSNFFSATREFKNDFFKTQPGQVPVLHITDLTACNSGFMIIQLLHTDLAAPSNAHCFHQYVETYYTAIKEGRISKNNSIPLYPESEGKQLHSISIALCSLTEKATLQLTVTHEQMDNLKQIMKKPDRLPRSKKAVHFNIIHDWEDDLSWCPSQCRLKIEFLGHHFILLLHWRHQDPWTAELIECEPDGAFRPLNNEDALHVLDIGHWKDSELRFAKHYAVERMVEWFRKECC